MATLNSLINVYIGSLFIPATPTILIVIRRRVFQMSNQWLKDLLEPRSRTAKRGSRVTSSQPHTFGVLTPHTLTISDLLTETEWVHCAHKRDAILGRLLSPLFVRGRAKSVHDSEKRILQIGAVPVPKKRETCLDEVLTAANWDELKAKQPTQG